MSIVLNLLIRTQSLRIGMFFAFLSLEKNPFDEIVRFLISEDCFLINIGIYEYVLDCSEGHVCFRNHTLDTCILHSYDFKEICKCISGEIKNACNQHPTDN